ncbi:hypothetical protein F511_30014 [Dorcoceras hygrometricum]|uniref:Uncharacterized protein n=1 Tax=Dorcoceras hygrometricum TaxID=472368 RepID=A0A2Z7BQV6_9LAMI|nr:hypothetical protein F511_30014 [Dorcoceras hygrometricum]
MCQEEADDVGTSSTGEKTLGLGQFSFCYAVILLIQILNFGDKSTRSKDVLSAFALLGLHPYEPVIPKTRDLELRGLTSTRIDKWMTEVQVLAPRPRGRSSHQPEPSSGTKKYKKKPSPEIVVSLQTC